MLRPRLTITSYVCGFTIALAGCARDVPQDPTVDPSTVTVAQFDPTNPIPVLQLIPTPTALAQNPQTGEIIQSQVAPEECELPTAAQCLQFQPGAWPTSVTPTLYFSRPPDMASLQEGIVWLEQTAAGLAPVSFSAVIRDRDPINAACMSGNNGSDPARMYTVDDIPPGVQVNLIPDAPLKPGTRYLMALVSNEDGGLRGPEGDVVYPSALFAILNSPEGVEPVLEDGTLADGLLRSQVQSAALAKLFPGRDASDLNDEERQALGAEIAASAARLRPLYGFISGLVKTFVDGGVVMDRNDLVFVNTWTTAGPAALVGFDPLAGVVPVPNTQLLTVPDETTVTGLRVNLPPDTSSPTRAALIAGLNTLDGFALLQPVITVTINALVDASAIQPNVAMYRVDENGNATGDSVPLFVVTSSVSTATTAQTTVRLVAAGPLPESTDFVVVIKSGVQTADGRTVARPTLYNLLALDDEPFVDGTTVPNPLIEQALQCLTVPATGMLAQDEEVLATAQTLETALNHPGWTATFQALENHTDDAQKVQRDEILLAWGYTTQTLTAAVDNAKALIDGDVWNMAVPGPKAVGPLPGTPVVGTASIAATVQVVENFCVAICEAGVMEPAIPRNTCATRDAQGNITAIDPGVPGNQFCQLAVNIIAGNLARASLYAVKGYELRSGSPYTSGTFSPAAFMMPEGQDLLVWVIEPNGTPPAEGWPVAMFQHGIGQVKESGFYIANTLANLGMATVLMDLPFHGSRASDLTMVMNTPLGPSEVPCTDANGVPNIDPLDVTCNPVTGQCVGGCDGIQDSSGTGLLSSNLFGTRDNLRQATVDQLTVIDALKTESVAGVFSNLDASSIGYIGQSLGGITGGNLAAYATPDDLVAEVLNVAGGDWVTILENTVPGISAPLFVALNQAGVCEYINPANPGAGCQPTPTYQEFLSTLRWVLEPADPAALSQAVPTGVGNANILMQMSLPDPVVPNAATGILAATYGFADLNRMTGMITPTDEQFQIYDFSALPQATIGSGCHGWILQPTCGRLDMDGDLDVADALCNSIGAQEQAGSFLLDQMAVAPKRPATVSGIPCP